MEYVQLVEPVQSCCGLDCYREYGLGVARDSGVGCVAFRDVFSQFEIFTEVYDIGYEALAVEFLQRGQDLALGPAARVEEFEGIFFPGVGDQIEFSFTARGEVLANCQLTASGVYALAWG